MTMYHSESATALIWMAPDETFQSWIFSLFNDAALLCDRRQEAGAPGKAWLVNHPEHLEHLTVDQLQKLVTYLDGRYGGGTNDCIIKREAEGRDAAWLILDQAMDRDANYDHGIDQLVP
jgi:hypothetical protein